MYASKMVILQWKGMGSACRSPAVHRVGRLAITHVRHGASNNICGPTDTKWRNKQDVQLTTDVPCDMCQTIE